MIIMITYIVQKATEKFKYRNFIKLPKQTNIMEKSITFVKITKPVKNDLNDELRWLGASLGLFQLRDKNSSCFRVFIEVLKSTKEDKGLTSDEIAYRTDLARGTVVHHLNKLMSEGIIVYSGKKYLLRSKDLEDVMDQIEQDSLKMIEEMRKIAKDIDNLLNP